MGILSDQIVMSERVLRGERDQRVESGGSQQGSLKMNGYYADGHRYPDNRAFWRGAGMVATTTAGTENISAHALTRK